MQRTVFTHIKGLVGAFAKAPERLSGLQMADFPVLESAYLEIIDDKIHSFGPMSDLPEGHFATVDCSGRFVMPTFVDSHTHLVFAASRENEFVQRIKGATYQEIATAGGGILNSALKLNATSEEELLDAARRRLLNVIDNGTGAIEMKSGYGLTYEGELKMLRVIRQLREEAPIPIRASFLGAHAIPLDYKNDREGYLKLLLDRLLPAIADEGLADYIDVFCEKVAFSPEETDRILAKATKFGLKPKIHTNQFYSLGGIEVAQKHNAISVDHLEVVNAQEIKALQGGTTIATLLPTAPFFLNDPYQPARDLLDANVCVALASDYNPGSSPSGNMSLVVAMGCIKLRMTPEESFAAATLNGAAALELSTDFGSITPGKKANLIVTKPMSSLAYFPYSFGEQLIEQVWINGNH